ncbi:DUF411 domain-containing protein [Lysobacter sp. A6]|uniref:DUF411 domain-containing protein n=1 Tax=Noviluteimonas lactosilytica TaxID=2888523 RepID=A0ABS8JD62_9GAMM|nr:DUF411 domain-containing protein [Lysobacter lactosilyticus]
MRLAAFALLSLIVAGCTAQSANVPAPVANETVAVADAAPPAMQWPRMIVHKSASCGCCAAWVEHVQKAGFEVEVRNEENLFAVKEKLGVPLDRASCHTAEVGGYFVEGHVPAEDIKRLLQEKPKAKGLALPGMPVGSPGMEVPGMKAEPFGVELVDAAGNTSVFANH